jgi:hypothetical protein
MSPRGVELAEKLSNLSDSLLACSYVPKQSDSDHPDDLHATAEAIRAADPLVRESRILY